MYAKHDRKAPVALTEYSLYKVYCYFLFASALVALPGNFILFGVGITQGEASLTYQVE